jgi:hypothetical protein
MLDLDRHLARHDLWVGEHLLVVVDRSLGVSFASKSTIQYSQCGYIHIAYS